MRLRLPVSSSLAGNRRAGARRQQPERRRGPADPARFAAAGIALACAAGLGYLVYADTTSLDAVEVAGARHVGAARALAAADLHSRPLFRASAAEARAALLRLPAVRDARVEISFPDARARIGLSEREAAGRWVVGSVEWFIDPDGVLFPSDDATAAPSLRVRDLRTAARGAGDRVETAVAAAALRLAKIAPGELRADATVPAVRVEPGPEGIVVASGAGWEIRFGTPERIEEKLSLALRFLREQPGRRLEYVDVRSAERIVFSPQ